MNSGILVSIVIPCYNEEAFIEKCITSLLSQENIPGEFEIIVAEGISTDSTRSILNRLSIDNPNLRIIDNEKKFTPFALNAGIKNSSGKYICIMGAHSEYDKNFISSCLNLFEKHPEADCVGGPISSRGRNAFAKATALAMSSTIGVGNAKHRFPEYEGFAEMACFPMFKRSVFDMIGYYDETLIRNQDDEFCFRLRLAGGKIYISPSVKSEYFVRESPSGLFKQYFLYGKYRIAVLKKHKISISFRQFVPVLFFLTLIILFIAGLVSGQTWIALTLPALYGAALLFFSSVILLKNGVKKGLWFPVCVFILHLSYAAGFIAGIIKVK